MRRSKIKQPGDTIIDLAGIDTEAKEAEKAAQFYQPVLCPQCQSNMILDSNPGRGGYYCSNVHCKMFSKVVSDSETVTLLDTGKHNKTTVIRSKIGSSKQVNDSPIEFIMEDKGQGFKQPYSPPDPDNGYEEKLVAEGAFIVNSTTYFPASKQTVTRKSKTPAEIAEERGYEHFNEI